MPYKQKNRYYDPKPDSSDDDDEEEEEEKKEDDDDDDEEEEEERPKQVVQVIQVIQVVQNDDDDDDDDEGQGNDEGDEGDDDDEDESNLRDNFSNMNLRGRNDYRSASGGYTRDDGYGNNSQDYARRETYRYEDGNISTGTEIRTWSQHMVPVRMKNFSDHYVQYRYSDGDTGQFVSQGVLEPNHVNTAMKVALNTRYHFEFRVGQKVIKKIKMFTREEEWDVDRFFEHL